MNMQEKTWGGKTRSVKVSKRVREREEELNDREGLWLKCREEIGLALNPEAVNRIDVFEKLDSGIKSALEDWFDLRRKVRLREITQKDWSTKMESFEVENEDLFEAGEFQAGLRVINAIIMSDFVY